MDGTSRKGQIRKSFNRFWINFISEEKYTIWELNKMVNEANWKAVDIKRNEIFAKMKDRPNIHN